MVLNPVERLKFIKRFPVIRITLKNFIIALSLTLLTIILFITAYILYISTKIFLTEKMDFINTTKLYQISSGVDEAFNNVEKIALSLQKNKVLTDMIKQLENPYTGAYERFTLSWNITQLLSGVKQYSGLIESINIITANNQYYSANLLFYSHLINSLELANDNGIVLKYPGAPVPDQTIPDFSGPIIETLNDRMYMRCSLSGEHGLSGNIYLLLGKNFLKGISPDMDSVLIFDGSNITIYKGKDFDSTAEERLKMDLPLNRDKKVIYTGNRTKTYLRTINYEKWTVMYMVKMNPYLKQFQTIRNLIVVAFLISFIISIVFSKFVTDRILRPILKLTVLIKKYRLNGAGINNMEHENKTSMSLREKFFYYFIITVLLPAIIFVVLFYAQSNNIFTEQISNAYNAIFTKTSENIEEYMRKKQTILYGIVYNDLVQSYLNNENGTDMDSLYDMIEQNVYLGLDTDTISIYDNSNNLVLTNMFRQKPSMDNDYYKAINKVFREFLWVVSKNDLNRYILTLGVPIQSVYGGDKLQKLIGYARMDMEFAHLVELYSELKSDSSEVFIIDKNGNIIANPSTPVYGREFPYGLRNDYGIKKIDISGQKYIFFYKKLGISPWYIASRYSYSDMTKQSLNILWNNIYIFIIILLIITLLSHYVSHLMLKPVNRVNRLFGKLDIGSMQVRALDHYFIDEINELGVNFNKMVVRLEDLIDELIIANMKKSEMEIERKNAEIIALQAQINPHFLYNTLDNIIFMIKEDYKEKAINTIKSLSSLFRYGISRGDMEIAIREEVGYAMAYTNIMMTRYNNSISFIWNIDENLFDCRTIKLILQPVIENAIYHGIDIKKENGVIEIECLDKADHIQFSIRDNGKGIPEDELRSIRENLSGDRIINKIGIYNVQLRLRLHYGEKFGLDIDSVYTKGTTVIITIPKKAKDG